MSDKRQTYDIDSPSHLNTPEAKISKEVATQFILKKVGRKINTNVIRKEVELMLRLTEEIEQKHELVLNNMCNRLNINSENANSIFNKVAEEIFHDGINWGRIIILYAFGGKLAEHCINTHNEQLVDTVGGWLGSNVAKKSSWIRDNGNGWNGFVETFQDVRCNKEGGWFQGMFAATVGFGTLAAALYIRS